MGLGCSPPSGTGASLGGRLSPGSLAPSARRSPGAIQGTAPPGPVGVPLSPGAAWRAIISRGRLACHCLRGRLACHCLRGRLACHCLRGRLAPNYLRGRLAPNYLRGRLAPNYLRGRLAYSCQAPCQTWPKDCLIPTEKGSQIRDAPKETADPRSFSSQSVMVSIGRNRNLLSPFQRDRADFR